MAKQSSLSNLETMEFKLGKTRFHITINSNGGNNAVVISDRSGQPLSLGVDEKTKNALVQIKNTLLQLVE